MIPKVPNYVKYNDVVLTKLKVITICGSMKFYEKMKEKELDLIAQGYTVLMPVMTDAEVTDQTLKLFKNTHLKKISMSNCIFVVNQDGYIGKDTAEEIEFASHIGIRIYFMESNRNELE